MLARVVNDNAASLTPRGVLGFIASMLAPTEDSGAHAIAREGRLLSQPLVAAVCVGASMLAMVVNDNAGSLIPRGVLGFIASMLAPTEHSGAHAMDNDPGHRQDRVQLNECRTVCPGSGR
jgi:hypothetical protein